MQAGATSPLSHRVLSAKGDLVLVGLKPARSYRGQRGRRKYLLVVHFHAFQALRGRQVDLVVKVFGVSNERIALQLLHVVQSDDVEVTR